MGININSLYVQISCHVSYNMSFIMTLFYFLNFSSRLSGDTCSGDTCSQILPIEEEDWTNWVSRKLMLLHVEG